MFPFSYVNIPVKLAILPILMLTSTNTPNRISHSDGVDRKAVSHFRNLPEGSVLKIFAYSER